MSTGTPSGTVVPILLPQAGNSMEEGTVLAWRVKVGDRVKPGDVLFDLETDKATIEVEAEAEGRVARIVVAPGQTAPVKSVVAYLSDGDVDLVDAPAPVAPVGAGPPSAPPSAVSPKNAQRHVSETGRVKASPVARKAAAALGVPLSSIAWGSGPDGRILHEDVIQASEAGGDPTTGAIRRPMNKMRRAIGRNLTLSKQTIPHFYLRATTDAGPLLDLVARERVRYRCSVNDVVVAACGRAMKDFPAFRSRIDGDDVIEFGAAHIGLAVALEEGLVVPTLRNVDRAALEEVARGTRRIAEAARTGKVEGMGESTLTISNLGMFGVEEFAAIINPPEAAILAVGAVRETVLVENGAMRPGKVMTMILSSDHRLIDGVVAAKFMARLKEILEHPESLMGGA
ncbi:MAG: 2-oxo acid dehydrogenase subunit E2 [Fimbriimonadaceae bacterium]|nr:2-oxo acid dehydrogenase subunit E2 [Fimbriimonadaceae bacterium]